MVIAGGGLVGLTLALDLARRGVRGGGAGRGRHRLLRLPRHLLRQAHAGDLRPARPRRAVPGEGRHLEDRPRLPRRPGGLRLRPAAGGGPRIPRLREPAAVLRRGMAGARPARRPAWSSCAGSTASPASSRARTARRCSVETPEGDYALDARLAAGLRWRAQLRSARALGLPFTRPGLPRPLPDRRRRHQGHVPFPTERWFWFDPPFHPGQSVLLHKQPDDVWRIDFQLGWDADPEEEKKPERVIRARARHAGAETCPSSWNGSASTPSAAGAWRGSGMGA